MDNIANFCHEAYMDIGVTASEAAGLPDQSFPLPDTDQYILELEVHHQLHCLDSLRRALSPFWTPMHPDGQGDDSEVYHPTHLGKYFCLASVNLLYSFFLFN